MININKVLLIGRLTRDPEVRTTPSGVTVASFTLAINRNFKNQEGNYDADFINISVFNKQAENIGKYVSKGSLIGCEGRIQTRSYDGQDGNKRYVTEVVAEHVEFLSSINHKHEIDNTQNQEITHIESPQDPFKNFGQEVALSDEDLPF